MPKSFYFKFVTFWKIEWLVAGAQPYSCNTYLSVRKVYFWTKYFRKIYIQTKSIDRLLVAIKLNSSPRFKKIVKILGRKELMKTATAGLFGELGLSTKSGLRALSKQL